MSTYDFCNNCGKTGHVFNLCKMPITSIGVIAFRKNSENTLEYLMIRRKDTLGYIDFIRGKYNIFNKFYILNMLNQMTNEEKENMKKYEFDDLWQNVWKEELHLSPLYQNEEHVSKEKFKKLKLGVHVQGERYDLNMLINESNKDFSWDEPEWGFPKGRRNSHEKDFDCALREFQEETGYSKNCLHNIQNLLPLEEIFTGSNYKSYKHKYYVMFMKYEESLNTELYQKSEVSKLLWKPIDKSLECIRYYNKEKKNVLIRLNNALTKYVII